ncbi:MAG: alpha/beta fold hydrolase, partial [Actinomycetaceae bacterium]|nr:alpha/beta fold hydrolase [Actinomycetaceae bacterium]
MNQAPSTHPAHSQAAARGQVPSCSGASATSQADFGSVAPEAHSDSVAAAGRPKYSTIEVNGLDVFYREAGAADKPTFLLLHGFPTSSHLFRNLIPLLERDFHVLAPDFIGFGRSAAPKHTDFAYTFEHLTDYVDGFLAAMGVESFYLYVFDYGAPIGFNLCLR